MSDIPTTSKAIAVNELDKAVLTKLINDYDCHTAIILFPKRNQEELPPVTKVDNNTAFDTQSSVNSSIDIEEINLIDFFNTPDVTNQQNATKLNTNEPEVLNIDVDELEKVRLKMAQERTKNSIYDSSLNFNTNFTSEATNSIDSYSIMNERNNTPAIIASKLNRSYSEVTVPDCRLEEKPKILLPKLERNISDAGKANKSEIPLSSLRHLLKTDSTERKCNVNATNNIDQINMSQIFISDNKFGNVSPPKLKHSVSDASQSRYGIIDAQNAFSNVNNIFEGSEISDRKPINFTLDEKPGYNEILTKDYSLNSTKTPQNQVLRDVHNMSGIFKNFSLNPKNSTPNILFDEIVRNEDIDEIYDDLLHELSSKNHNKSTVINNTIEVGATSFQTPLSQTVITNSIEQLNTNDQKGNIQERLYPRKFGDNSSVISKPIRTSQTVRRVPEEFVLNEEQKAYIDKLLRSRYNIQNPLSYYFPENFYEPDPKNIDERVLIMNTIEKKRKVYNNKNKRIITSDTDREKFTKGPGFEEKQQSLPQMMKKLKDKKERLDNERNLKKRLILGSGTIQGYNFCDKTRSNPPNISSGVTLNPVILTEDRNGERMRALGRRQKFDDFMQTGSYL